MRRHDGGKAQRFGRSACRLVAGEIAERYGASSRKSRHQLLHNVSGFAGQAQIAAAGLDHGAGWLREQRLRKEERTSRPSAESWGNQFLNQGSSSHCRKGSTSGRRLTTSGIRRQ
jgi:hypothetical protein